MLARTPPKPLSATFAVARAGRSRLAGFGMAPAVAIVLAVGALTAATPALAFRPSAKWLLDRTMDKAIDRGTKSLKVDATVAVYDENGARIANKAGDETAERTWLSSSGPAGLAALRRETDSASDVSSDGAAGPSGGTVELRVDGKSTVRVAGQAEKSQKAGVDFLADVMVAAPPVDSAIAADKLIGAFKGLGVNTEVVSYARFDGRVAYLIGSKPWESDKPQVWIEKDSFLPVRIVTFQKAPGGVVKLDIRYLGWGSPVGGAWYPQTIEIWRGDKLVRRSSTQNVERNAAVDATLFK